MSLGPVRTNPRASVKLAPLHVPSELGGSSLGGSFISPNASLLDTTTPRPRQLDPMEGFHEYVLLSPRVFNMFGRGR